MYRLGLAILLVSLSVVGLSAQPLEVGASIATSCKGSDGSFCYERGLRTIGPYVGVWLGDRVEVGARLVWLEFGDVRGRLFEPPAEFLIIDRSRLVTQAEVIWHFRRGKRVRPMFGVGVGTFRDREVISCQPAGCEAVLPGSGLAEGTRHDSEYDESLVVGLSIAATPRLRVRGGWRYHNPFRDELALSELFVAVGYRFVKD